MPIEKGCTHCGSDQHNTTECPMRDAAPAGEREAFRAWQTKDDWKRPDDPGELEAFQAGAAWQRTQSAGVPDVSAMARVLSDRSADACNIDRTDNWAMYGQEYIEDVQAMLAAPAQPAVQQGDEVRRLREALQITRDTIDGQLEIIASRAHGNYLDKLPVVRSLKAHRARCDAALSAQGEGERT